MSRSVECKCESNFTCGYCLRNAKPYFFTLASGERSYQLPAFLCQPGTASKKSQPTGEK